MTAYLEGKAPDEETLKKLIRKAVISGAFYPVLCGSAFKNKGVQPLLDAVVDFLPSPIDVPAIKGIDPKGNEIDRKPDDKEPMSLLAFKIMDDPFVGTITFCRIYSGTLTSGTGVINSTKERKERIGRMLLMHANNREDIKEAYAGDIVALAGLKDTRTGDTLCDPAHEVILEKMEFPEPVISLAIEPKTKADQDKLGKALKSLSDEDPTFRVRTEEETAQTVISGMGELHLEILVDRMQREFNVVATVGKPQVAYRETITKTVESVEYRHIKQSGGSGQFAVVKIDLEPNPGKGYEFVDKISGGRIPREYIQPTNQGIRSALDSGVLAGYPTVDVKASLVDGQYHDVDSSEMAFKIAGQMAFKKAAEMAKPVILEPIMQVEVVTPEEYMGGVVGDLNSRRGQIQARRRGRRMVSGATQRSDPVSVCPEADSPAPDRRGPAGPWECRGRPRPARGRDRPADPRPGSWAPTGRTCSTWRRVGSRDRKSVV